MKLKVSFLPKGLLYRPFTLSRKLHAPRPFINTGGGGGAGAGSGGQANFFLMPGATMATIFMLGILHARRMYDDKKVEEMKGQGLEPEFAPDAKASFLRLLPLGSISQIWRVLASAEIPVSLRPVIYKAWARAFHSNLEEASLPLDQYASLQEFFARALKEGSRPIDMDPNCLVSPVDGTILRFGELKEPGAKIEQVKGFSYSAFALLGAGSTLHEVVSGENTPYEDSEPSPTKYSGKRSWWRISFSSPKVRSPTLPRPMKGVFYCVIYLHPGDYHRVHSPVDCNILIRRHFSGRLFPVNERATRTISNLHIENERVVLEGRWEEGFIAMAAIGATNVGSIKLCIEPELSTNKSKWKFLASDPPEERLYEPEGVGVMLKKGEEVAAFNMGSTVVLVFQAPIAAAESQASPDCDGGQGDEEFKFCIRKGDKVSVGQALGRWAAPGAQVCH